jgi:hypothetical protein
VQVFILCNQISVCLATNPLKNSAAEGRKSVWCRNICQAGARKVFEIFPKNLHLVPKLMPPSMILCLVLILSRLSCTQYAPLLCMNLVLWLSEEPCFALCNLEPETVLILQ